MSRESLLRHVAGIRRPFFTTRDMVSLSGKSPSAVVQGLRHLARQGLIRRVYRGVWARADAELANPFDLIPALLTGHRAYLSFISALHLHGIVSQIPQTVTLASTAHSRVLRTELGVFAVHRIGPDFFWGFGWYRGTGSFLIAEPEKALLDCLYVAGRKGRNYAHFPELAFPPGFSFHKARLGASKIRDPRLRVYVLSRLADLRTA